jgi:hypothetical protein
MRKWMVVFSDAPQRGMEIAQAAHADSTVDFMFDAAARTGEIDGQIVSAMWLLDPENDRADVLAVYGSYSVTIGDRITALTRCFRTPKAIIG